EGLRRAAPDAQRQERAAGERHIQRRVVPVPFSCNPERRLGIQGSGTRAHLHTPRIRSLQTMKNWKRAVMGAAVASMFAAGAAFADAPKTDKAAGDVKCQGGNACSGKGGCAGADNSCAGKNSCKGKGWTMTKNADECTKAGGKVVAAADK